MTKKGETYHILKRVVKESNILLQCGKICIKLSKMELTDSKLPALIEEAKESVVDMYRQEMFKNQRKENETKP